MGGVDWMSRSVIGNGAGRKCRKMEGVAADLRSGWAIWRREWLRRRESSRGYFVAESLIGFFASEKREGPSQQK
ncbi:hypothetical protein MRB53_011752 [Persea americana]|uniref:Uncharacterized protein n=1 Tax=Persea americana TaxID=3435 RepID=A0ACC2LVT0_PERAE|nr:hypothetical protein MRB53_011752 [Persea americana]